MNTIISKAWTLVKPDLIKIAKGALIAIGGALVAYLGQLSGTIDYSHYGVYGSLIAVVISTGSSILINVLNKWINSSTYIN
jgi:hypothetical protein